MKTKDKIVTPGFAKKKISVWRKADERIVFTNGCFDLLHAGHVQYLEKARLLGDRLVVGLNTDTSVRRIKGSGRPVQDQQSRSEILAALKFVDLVVFFEEDTPENLVRTLLPDVLVKGGDYHPDNIAGAEIVRKNGGKVETIELLSGYSTSQIIDKIKNT